MLLHNKWVKNRIKEEIKRYLETNESENTITQNLWDKTKSGLMREIHSNTGLPQEARKISNKHNLTLHLKEVGKEQPINPKVSRRKEIIKIRAEIN